MNYEQEAAGWLASATGIDPGDAEIIVRMILNAAHSETLDTIQKEKEKAVSK